MLPLKKFYILLLILLITDGTLAQTIDVEGIVSDESGVPVPGARILLQNSKTGAVSKSDGTFLLPNLKRITANLIITAHSYDTAYINIPPDQLQNKLLITLKERRVTAGEVVVVGKSESDLKRIESIKIDVIDTRQIRQEASDLSQVLNRTPGVKIRSSGSIGSGSEINLNGLQGKAVRLFRDGIPVDYLGRAFDISLLGVNNLERIEVYKGILPVSLGADALGGGVNFVSNILADKELGVSYELSSYHTHRASLNSQYLIDPASGLFTSMNAQFNTSRNNYDVDVLLTDNETGGRVPITTPRFHDNVESIFTEATVGIQGQSWADLFSISFAYSDFKKDFQHGPLMTTAFGSAQGSESGFVSSLNYRSSLFSDATALNIFGAYSTFNTILTDTSTKKYNWEGNVIYVDSVRGEASQNMSYQDIVYRNVVSRVNINHDFSNRIKSSLNYCLTYQDRIGSDIYGPRNVFTGLDPLTIKASYLRNIIGGEISAEILPEMLTSVASVKWYDYSASGAPTSPWRNYQIDPVQRTSNSIIGGSLGLRLIPDEHWLIRASFEKGVRLPDGYELFGDGQFILNNFLLKPETSNNINLSAEYRSRSTIFDAYSLELNLFYRGLKNLIILLPEIPFSVHENYNSAIGKGAEFSFSLTLLKYLRFGGNVTYQDFRRVDITESSEKYLEGSRVPNRPYFFYNLQAHYSIRDVFHVDGSVQFYYYMNSVQQFYLQAIPKSLEPSSLFGNADIDTELLIPSYMTHTAGVSYVFPRKTLVLSAELENITDMKTYDNFRIQKPGRMFHLKASYLLQDLIN